MTIMSLINKLPVMKQLHESELNLRESNRLLEQSRKRLAEHFTDHAISHDNS